MLPPNRSPDGAIIFLTVNAMDRRRILAEEERVAAIRAAWEETDGWIVGRYVIMPDHIHLFCAESGQPTTLEKWMMLWKRRASNHWPSQDELPLFQDGGFNHWLRTRQEYDSKWDYVWRNPVRAELCEKPEDWPFQGEIHRL